MSLVAQLAALLGILSTGVVYGTDVFSAIALRPALARVDDASMTSVMGNVHRYADRRMTVPGVLAIVASAAAAVLAVLAGSTAAAVAAGLAFGVWIVWMMLYQRISAPINRRLTAAVDAHETPADARVLQERWDRIIVLRSVLQGAAMAALGAALILS
jgi:hypothetical protein